MESGSELRRAKFPPDLPIYFYPPRRFELAPHPHDFETVVLTVIETPDAPLIGLGLEHLVTEDPSNSSPPIDPPRQTLFLLVRNRFVDHVRRNHIHQNARMITEGQFQPDPDTLLRVGLPGAIHRYFGEGGAAQRAAAKYNKTSSTNTIDVLPAEMPMARQYQKACEAMTEFGYDSEDVFLWFALREYAWCRSIAALSGQNFTNYVRTHLETIFTRNMELQFPFQLESLQALYAKKGFGDLSNLSPNDCDRFLRFENPPMYKEVQRFITHLRDQSSSETFTETILRGIPGLAVYGKDHLEKQYERTKRHIVEIGFPIEEVDWSPDKNCPRFFDPSWLKPGGTLKPAVDHGAHSKLLRGVERIWETAFFPRRE